MNDLPSAKTWGYWLAMLIVCGAAVRVGLYLAYEPGVEPETGT